MKKITAIFLSLLILLSTALYVAADEDDDIIDKSLHTSSNGNYTYKKVYSTDGGVYGCRIIKYIGKNTLSSTYTLPKYIDGFDVQAVEKNAFTGISAIKTLKINRSTTLKSLAFNNCKKLTKVISDARASFGDESVGYYNGKKISGFKFIANVNDPYITGATARYIIESNDSVYYAAENGFSRVLNLFTKNKYTVQFEKSGISFSLRVNGNKVANWKSSNKKAVTVSKNGKARLIGKGTSRLTAKLKNNKKYTVKFKVNKKGTVIKDSNPMTVTSKTKIVDYCKLKKSAQKVLPVSVKKAQGKVTYKRVSGSKKLTLKSNGKVVVKKGSKKGTYKMKVRVTAKGNSKYESAKKTVTVKIKVK